MKTDPAPFIAAALSGIASNNIHHQVHDDGTHRVKAEDVAKRAVEIGVATAAAYDAIANTPPVALVKPPQKSATAKS